MSEPQPSAPARAHPVTDLLTLAVRWAWVSVPLAWGVWQTARTSFALFR